MDTDDIIELLECVRDDILMWTLFGRSYKTQNCIKIGRPALFYWAQTINRLLRKLEQEEKHDERH